MDSCRLALLFNQHVSPTNSDVSTTDHFDGLKRHFHQILSLKFLHPRHAYFIYFLADLGAVMDQVLGRPLRRNGHMRVYVQLNEDITG